MKTHTYFRNISKFTIRAYGGLGPLYRVSALWRSRKRDVYHTVAAWALAGAARAVPLSHRALEGAARACFSATEALKIAARACF